MSDVTTNGSTSSGSVSSPSSSPSSSCDEESVAGKTIDELYSSRVEVLKCITDSFDPSPRGDESHHRLVVIASQILCKCIQ